MLVEAVYDNGRLLLPKEWHFVHQRFKVKVDLPEAEIIHQKTGNKVRVDSFKSASVNVSDDNYHDEYIQLKKLQEAAFGPDYHYIQEKSDKDILLEVLSEKYA